MSSPGTTPALASGRALPGPSDSAGLPAGLADLLGRLGRPQLIGYHFEQNELRFQLFGPVSARLVSFSSPTDTVHARGGTFDPVRSTCTVQFIELATRLGLRHDRYFPPTESSLLLLDARDRVTLAYGRRGSEARWLVNLMADRPLLSFLVRDLAEIRWIEE